MSENPNRRDFLKTTAAAGAGAVIASRPASARVIGANDRIRLGAIGTGSRCRYLMEVLNGLEHNDIVAACDVYEPNLIESSRHTADGADLYSEYRRVLDRRDIDAVVIGTPDHWHARLLMDAVASGKDVYCEKPMTHRLEEGPQIVNAVRQSGRVVQTGTQQRSWPHWLLAADLIREGRLGTITMAHAYWYQSYGWQPERRKTSEFDPSRLDRKTWLGNAPDQPVDEEKFDYWRWYWDFGGGALTDLMTHWIDMIHLYIGQSTPLSATTTAANRMHPKWQCPDTITCALEYPRANVTYTGTMVSSIDDGGLEVRGTKGTLKIDRERLLLYPEDVPTIPHRNYPEPEIQAISERDGTIDHMQNFLDCIRSRRSPNANVQIGMEAARASHLGNLSLRGGRRVEFNAATQSVKV